MQGIENYWKGSFTDSRGTSYEVATYTGQRSSGVPVEIIDKNGQSIHSRPWFNGWSHDKPGSITMYTGFKGENGPSAFSEFKNSSAYEFGHLLVLEHIKGSVGNTMMKNLPLGDPRNVREVSSWDMAGVLKAMKTGKWGQ